MSARLESVKDLALAVGIALGLVLSCSAWWLE